jgi:hypothetical protein
MSDKLAEDIIEIDDYEVKDKEIVETTEEDDYQSSYNNQREYDDSNRVSGYYKSISLSNTSLVIILMVILALVVIFIMTFD